MRKSIRIVILAAVIVVIAGIILLKHKSTPSSASRIPQSSSGLPEVVDLGSKYCNPCKEMAPILAELSKEYAGRAKVTMIDVREDKNAGYQYGIRVIPTQIFFDASGKEVRRHEGFLSKEDIEAQLKLVGVK